MVGEKSIPEGYKETEVGVIPEDWEVATFGDVLTGFNSGATPSRRKSQYYKGNIKWVTSGELNYNIINDTLEKISYDAMLDTNLSIQPIGTLLIAITGLEAQGTRGSCAILGVEATTNQSCMALHTTDRITTNFLFHYYRYKGANFALKYCQGTKQQSYTGKLVKILPIPLPPLQEQKAIAEVLSDMDKLIAAIEKLIAKKQKIKQGTMQLLLTGKKRLPGFTGDWEVKRLVEILKVKHGKSQHQIVDADGEYPILATGGEIGRTNQYLYNKPSVLIGRKGTIDRPQYIETPFWTIDTLFYTEISSKSIAKYIYYLFNRIDWYSYNEASGVPSLNASTIEEISIPLPPLPEQRAIAQILSDMDAEIEALEKKLEKYRLIKAGMMEKLLTGEVRLV